MARTDEMRADLRQRRAKAEAAFQKFKFEGLVRDVEPMALLSAEADEIAAPSIPGVRGIGRRV
jgi:hypothetical protein